MLWLFMLDVMIFIHHTVNNTGSVSSHSPGCLCVDIVSCGEGPEGRDLLASAGQLTLQLRPKVYSNYISYFFYISCFLCHILLCELLCLTCSFRLYWWDLCCQCHEEAPVSHSHVPFPFAIAHFSGFKEISMIWQCDSTVLLLREYVFHILLIYSFLQNWFQERD